MSKCWKAMVFVLAMMLARSVFAYDYPLSLEAIREAYFIGNRRDTSTADFIERYTQHFPVPKNGPYVAMIQLETPYAQIVEHARQAINYNAPDAVQEFLGKPGVFRLRVQIYFTPSYAAVVESKHGTPMVRAHDFWRDFKITLVQGTEIHAERVGGHALYGNGTGRRIGAQVQLDYKGTAIRSGPAKAEVLSPEGEEIETYSFDLATLR
jgi:hypothetical protein